MSRNLILASMGVAGFVALLTLLDLVLKVPFGGYSPVFDILFLVAAAILLYIGWETYQETK